MKEKIKCVYCGSNNIEKGIHFELETEPYKIGIPVKYSMLKFGVLELHADLCYECKSITRIYIKDNLNNCKILK